MIDWAKYGLREPMVDHGERIWFGVRSYRQITMRMDGGRFTIRSHPNNGWWQFNRIRVAAAHLRRLGCGLEGK